MGPEVFPAGAIMLKSEAWTDVNRRHSRWSTRLELICSNVRNLKNEAWTDVFKHHFSLFNFSLLTRCQPHYHAVGSLSWLLMEKNPIWWTWEWSKITRTCDLSLHKCVTKSGVESSCNFESLTTLYSLTNQPSSIRRTSPLEYRQLQVSCDTEHYNVTP